MSLFQSSRLHSTNGGAISMTVQDQQSDQGAVIGRPGVGGSARGTTSWTIRTDPRFIVWSECYFSLRGFFTDASATPLVGLGLPNLGTVASPAQIACCDNWPSTLFNNIKLLLNGEGVEQCQYPAQIDTVATYSVATNSFLKSYGSASGVGESLKARIAAAGVQPRGDTPLAGGTNAGRVVATWRPPLSIFNTSNAIRGGSQWKIQFAWSATAEQNVCESAGVDQLFSATGNSGFPLPAIAGTDYLFFIEYFNFNIATVLPDPIVAVPRQMIIDLTPCAAYQLNIVNASGGSFNVSIPTTTFRIAAAMQNNDNTNNTARVPFSTAAGVNGIFPITNFVLGLSNTAGANTLLQGAPSWLTQFSIGSVQLGFTIPNPIYTFTTQDSKGGFSQVTRIISKEDLSRAYRDFIQSSSGDHGLCEGGLSFGNLDTGVPINSVGVSLAANGGAGAFSALQVGDATGGAAAFPPGWFTFADPQNNNATDYVANQVSNVAGKVPGVTGGTIGPALIATNAIQRSVAPKNLNMATYGWLGRFPILSLPIVKSVSASLSQIDVRYTMSSAPSSAIMYIFAYYTACIVINYGPNGDVVATSIESNN